MYWKFVDEIRDFLELAGDPSFKAQGDKNKPQRRKHEAPGFHLHISGK